MVRNVFLIFIHDKLSINEVRIKVIQASDYVYSIEKKPCLGWKQP